MKILLTGSTGLIGKKVARALALAGHEMTFVGRDPKRALDAVGLPGRYQGWEAPPPEGIEAVIHLAGESVSQRRWTSEYKAKLIESRVATTRRLVESFQDRVPPRVWVNASAIGYYGDRGEEALNEKSEPGRGFLAYLCQDWEAESARIHLERGTRWVSLRIGLVLAREGGALSKLAPVFALGLGGPLGGGCQWVSWIHVDDLVRLVEFSLSQETLHGPVNAVAPAPVRNREFGRELGRVLRRPALLPVPRFAIKAALGEQSAIALDSQRAIPEKALAAGFEFRFPNLGPALDGLFQGSSGGRVFEATQWVPAPRERVFEFLSDARNLEGITPPWLHFKILGQSTDRVGKGTLIDCSLKLHGIPVSWLARIDDWGPHGLFQDVQLKGPYAKWEHTHSFTPLAGGTLIEDRVVYRLPAAAVGDLIAGSWASGDVSRIFEYRRRALTREFGAQGASERIGGGR